MSSLLALWLGVYLGGFIAIAMLTYCDVLLGDEGDPSELLGALLWSLLLPWYLFDVVRGRRP